MRHCASCGFSLPRDARFCSACGAPVRSNPAPLSTWAPVTGATQRLAPDPGPDAALPCLRCGAPLELGFIPERDGDRRSLLWWVAGDPQRYRVGRRIVIDPATMWLLRAFRCPACGYVELSATERRTLPS